MVDRQSRCPLADRSGGSKPQHARYPARQPGKRRQPTSPRLTGRTRRVALTSAYHARAARKSQAKSGCGPSEAPASLRPGYGSHSRRFRNNRRERKIRRCVCAIAVSASTVVGSPNANNARISGLHIARSVEANDVPQQKACQTDRGHRWLVGFAIEPANLTFSDALPVEPGRYASCQS